MTETPPNAGGWRLSVAGDDGLWSRCLAGSLVLVSQNAQQQLETFWADNALAEQEVHITTKVPFLAIDHPYLLNTLDIVSHKVALTLSQHSRFF